MNSYCAVLAFCLVAAASATTPEKCNKCTKNNITPTTMPDCGTGSDMDTCETDEWCMSKNTTTKQDDGTWKMEWETKCASPSSDQTETCTTGTDSESTFERTCWCKTAVCVDPLYSGAGMVAGFTLATLASVILAKIL